MSKPNLKNFLTNFDFSNPDWNQLPTDWPECDLSGLSSGDVGKFNSILGLWNLHQSPKPASRSRQWQDPKGYRFLTAWSNAVLLRILAKKWLDFIRENKGINRNTKDTKGKPSPNTPHKFPLNTHTPPLKSHKFPLNTHKPPLNSPKPSFNYQLFNRLEAQLLDALRSTIANIEEGFTRPTTSEYLQFLGYSQASLGEATGDIQRGRQDKFLKSVSGSKITDLGIDLKAWNLWCRDPANSSKLLYFPLKESKGNFRNLNSYTYPYNPIKSSKEKQRTLKDLPDTALTYEIFTELTNKTDYLLRKLVESLENKLNNDKKGYQVERARIRGNVRGRM